jgi:hypothetical protein
MKRAVLIIAVMISTCTLAYSQELGLRFGYAGAPNVAVDGVFSVSKFSRIHADIAFGNGAVDLDVLWDFLYKPLGDEAFNWYLGVGPYIRIDDPFHLGVAGEAGLEYRFKGAPLALGLDWRPRVSIIENTDFYADGFGLNLRYVF